MAEVGQLGMSSRLQPLLCTLVNLMFVCALEKDSLLAVWKGSRQQSLPKNLAAVNLFQFSERLPNQIILHV